MKLKILLIEDNEQNLYLMTYLLEHAGYQVVPAPDGRRGVDLAAAHDLALILLDIQLPGMDGYAVAQALRANRALDGVPIVAVTSYAMAGDREKILAAGCAHYMEKPIDPDSFVEEIGLHLAGSTQSREGE